MSLRSVASGIARWFRDEAPGTLFYLDANLEETALPLPADAAAQLAAGTPYVLIAQADRPAWALIALDTVDGFGTGFGDAFGED